MGQAAYAAEHSPLTNYGSGMCLAPVADPFLGQSLYDNGVTIWQVSCTGAPEQQWTKIGLQSDHNPNTGGGGLGFPPLETVDYLVNRATGLCLDVADATTANGARIQQWTCNGGGSEKWFEHPSAFGYIQWTDYRTHKCLDVPNASTTRVVMQQYACWANPNVAQMYTLPS